MSSPNQPSNTNILSPISQAFQTFYDTGALSGILLILAAMVALIWVNLIDAHSYEALWHTHLSFRIGEFKIDKPLHIWINDGLMAIFFFYVGLEIKREVMVGELSERGKITLPIMAALGGMIVPASLFLLFQWNQPGMSGWGIPMATDIAFSLGILMLLGNKVPISLKIFLTAFAIVDDIGAVSVIALFYSKEPQFNMLYIAVAFYGFMWIANFMKLRRLFYFIIPALFMWYFVLESGVHPTIAGVLAALAIPARKSLRVPRFAERTNRFLDALIDNSSKKLKPFLSQEQLDYISKIQKDTRLVEPAVQRLEYRLDSWISFFIMPLFALSNAGVQLLGGAHEGGAIGTLSLAIVIGLVFGKVIGILGASWIAVRLKIATLPEGANWKQLLGIAFLGGIGFTMSLFIGNLAFEDPALVKEAKIGILIASLLAGLIGYILLRRNLDG